MGSFRDKFSKKQYKTACFINKEKKTFQALNIFWVFFFSAVSSIHQVDFQSELKPKYDILLYVVIIILWGKYKITTNYKISYFGIYFDWKSTSYFGI